MRASASMTVIALFFTAGSAMAQTTTPSTAPATPTAPSVTTPAANVPPPKPIEGQITTQDQNTVLGSELMRANVYSPDNVNIGKVSDIILKRDGTGIEGIVIGVGGFLGIGEKWVAVKMDKVKLSEVDGTMRLVLSSTKDDLTAAPAFKTKQDQAAESRSTVTPPSTAPRATPGSATTTAPSTPAPAMPMPNPATPAPSR